MDIEVVNKKPLTTNQEIYKQIRSYMDKASREYEKKRENEKNKELEDMKKKEDEKKNAMNQ